MPSLSSTAALLALAATSAFALTSTSAKSDLDGSVWKALEASSSRAQSRAAFAGPQQRNRPAKRQSGWNPPSELSGALTEVWEHYEKTYDGSVFNNKNWGWDQVVANNGSLNICVRWDSTASVTAAQRAKIASVYAAQYQKWFKWVYGFDGFPYANVDVNIVGWAVRDAALLQGSTDGVDVYTSYKDGEGVPACAPTCDRAAHLDGDFGGCEGGEGSHFDHSLWLTDGLEGGFGYDWGQQVGREYLLNNIDSGSVHILLHEMLTIADWTPTGQSKFIMLAGSSMEITDFDGWMYRNWWYELSKNRGWTKSASSSNSGATASTSASASASASAAPTVKEDAVARPTSAPANSAAPVAVEPETTAPAAAEPSAPAAGDSDAESGATVGRWSQCGGSGYTGATACAAGLTCAKTNEWYSQCL
ncbi:putative acetylxylan esterase A [Colletotrichum liriopes]|uniref:Acetylxylan esterase A n=1 Tax=Colletotrichum liriopes TaxID=708192 RepID=A0AA37GW50_9PEZI|nr:putative acetylxylan esterase A [Colletotrichum liriopes]